MKIDFEVILEGRTEDGVTVVRRLAPAALAASIIPKLLAESYGSDSGGAEPITTALTQRKPISEVARRAITAVSQADIAKRVLLRVGQPLELEELLGLVRAEPDYASKAADPLTTLSSALYRRKDVFVYQNGKWHLVEWPVEPEQEVMPM